jgi:hypothetical protein
MVKHIAGFMHKQCHIFPIVTTRCYNRSKNITQGCAHSFCLINLTACMQGVAAGPAPKKTLLKRMGTGDTIAPALRKLFRTNRVAQTLLLLLVLMMTAMVIGDGVLTPAQTGRGLWDTHGRAQPLTHHCWLVLCHATCCAQLPHFPCKYYHIYYMMLPLQGSPTYLVLGLFSNQRQKA